MLGNKPGRALVLRYRKLAVERIGGQRLRRVGWVAVCIPEAIEYCVVLIECAQIPGRKFDAAVSAISHFRPKEPPDRVVEHQRSDTFFFELLESMSHYGRAEVGLVSFDRLALVVEDGFAVGNPA